MRKYLLLTLVFTSGLIITSAQSSEKIIKDSLAIDSMQKILPVLKDTARINCLNNIAEQFLDRGDYKFKRKCDTAVAYSGLAIKEATISGYKYGIAKSLLVFCNCHNLYSFHNRNTQTDNSANLIKWEADQKQLFELAPQINNAEIWGRTYSNQSNLMSWKKNDTGELIALENALKWFKLAGNDMGEGEISTLIGYMHSNNGNYENALEYFVKALQVAKKLNKNVPSDEFSQTLLEIGFMNVSDMYSAAGDYESALNYLREYRQLSPKNQGSMKLQLADLFILSGQHDSAFHYLHQITYTGNQLFAFLWSRIGDAFLLSGNKDSAMYYYSSAIDSLRKDGQFWPVVQSALMTSCLGKAKILATRNDYKTALKLAKESSALAQMRNNKIILLSSYDLQSQLFNKLGKNDSAYNYLRKYITMKDSILTRQFLWKLKNYKNEVEEAKRETRIGFLNRDNKIKEEQIKQEASLKKFLITGLGLLLIAAIFIFRYFSAKRKNEKLQQEQAEQEWKLRHLESEKKQAELEMQALRAQMNPHFIFNCLSSINRFILKNESKTASNYLTRFSRLIRMVLINSQKPLIALEDELQMLRLYLDMERLRFKDSFDYRIAFLNTMDGDNIFIPPLLLQPFCENAIWHGLMHKEGQGMLDIELSMQDNILNCTITDNGVGREKADEMNSKSVEKEKSMGLKITAERLAILNREKGVNTFYEIEDLVDENGNAAGTKINLKISYKDSVEELIQN